MDYPFSERVSSLAPSAIREIMKYSSVPGFISLALGSPAPNAFPAREISEISARIFSERPVDALQYSVTEGYTPLREHLAEYMKEKHSIGRDFDNIIITSGAQQVMELATKTLCNEGDVVICESPTFIGSLNAFRSYRTKQVGVEMEPDGINIEKLEAALKANPNAKLIYTIPNFQNPTGITMSLEKRRAVYELAKKYGVLILEDNPYGDIRFSGEPLPTIKSMDEEGIVIYAGSFSKVLSPGLRVGFTVAPAPIVQKMVVCKQVSDVHTQIWSQMVAHTFMTEYDYEAHLERIRGVYRDKSALTDSLLKEHLSGFMEWSSIEGGLFYWLKLPQNVDLQTFCTRAAENKVAVVPGTAFSVQDEPMPFVRINYSAPTDEKLAQAIELLGGVAKTF